MKTHPRNILASITAGALALGLFTAAPVFATDTLLIGAGGGGGGGLFGGGAGGDAQSGTAGQRGLGGGGAGGMMGMGGSGGSSFGNGGGGGGWLGNGTAGPGAISGAGGSGAPAFTGGAGNAGVIGGFGGGGGAGSNGGGGGGGYSGGGGGGGLAGGGGGGSYIDPAFTAVTSALAASVANGSVTIGGMLFAYTGSMVQYTVPTTGSYIMTVLGAGGGTGLGPNSGGHGAMLSGTINFTAGTVVDVWVGGLGSSGVDVNDPGAGGGGSFVAINSVPTAPGVPETGSSLLLLSVGLAGLVAVRSRVATSKRAQL